MTERIIETITQAMRTRKIFVYSLEQIVSTRTGDTRAGVL
jgi:nitrogen regulatory protein PII